MGATSPIIIYLFIYLLNEILIGGMPLEYHYDCKKCYVDKSLFGKLDAGPTKKLALYLQVMSVLKEVKSDL